MSLVGQGDPSAAAEVVQRFEPKIHQAIRKPLRYSLLRRELDPHDISQVVLAKFFVGNLAVRCEIVHPEQLTRLLVRMARNKIRDELRKLRARHRAGRRIEHTNLADAVVSNDFSPIKIVANQELLQVIYMRLDDDTRQLAEERYMGTKWSAIARTEGKSSEAIRKKLARAMERVRVELDL